MVVLKKNELVALEYEQFLSSMNTIRKRGDEMLATTKFSEMLTEKLANEFDLDIKIYKTIGTVLDKYHKISAWVETVEPAKSGGKIFVTLDIFTDIENKRNKADIVFRKPDCGFSPEDENNEEYNTVLEDLAKAISDKFLEKGKIMEKISKKKEMEKPDWGNLKGKRVVNFKK